MRSAVAAGAVVSVEPEAVWAHTEAALNASGRGQAARPVLTVQRGALAAQRSLHLLTAALVRRTLRIRRCHPVASALASIAPVAVEVEAVVTDAETLWREVQIVL